MITIVGLGCEYGQLTIKGAKAIDKAKTVFVKTSLTDTYKYFEENNIPAQSLDFIYEQSQDFDDLDKAIVDYVENAHKNGDVLLCVNGSGYDDRAVIMLCNQNKDIEIIPSVSRGVACGVPCVGLTTISAYELVANKGFNYDTRLSLTITDIDNMFIAGEVKLILQNILGDEQEVIVNGKKTMIYELDRLENYDYATCVCVPPLELTKKQRFNFIDLYLIMQILRGENGCEWDKAQDHMTIRENAIEEAYELVEAINNDDIDNMIEECGDLILQSVFHCVIGEDMGEFNLDDSMSGICRKLIDRHTHIFGDVIANNAEEALRAWDNAKAKEKKYKSNSHKMESVAKALPSLMRAEKIQKIAGKASFEFQTYEQVLDKIQEEYNEYVNAEPDQLENEGGDLLFACVNALRWKGIDSEVALTKTINKFLTRYKYVEKMCGGDTKGRSLEELNLYWSQSKL